MAPETSVWMALKEAHQCGNGTIEGRGFGHSLGGDPDIYYFRLSSPLTDRQRRDLRQACTGIKGLLNVTTTGDHQIAVTFVSGLSKNQCLAIAAEFRTELIRRQGRTKHPRSPVSVLQKRQPTQRPDNRDADIRGHSVRK